MKILHRLLPLSVLSIVSASLMAQPYNRIVAFGDSLTDSGQYPDSGAPALELGGTTVYTSGLRLTNRVGPTYLPNNTEVTAPIAMQRVSQRLGLGELNPSSAILPGIATGNYRGFNYARAGSTSAEILASINEPGGASVRVEGLGLVTERDGYLVESPRADGRALYYVNGGANDIFAGIPGYVSQLQGALGAGDPPPAFAPEGLSEAVDNLVAGVRALDAAGARYIMVSNLPDLGSTPLAAGLDAQFSQASAALAGFVPAQLNRVSAEFNTEFYAALNDTGANVIPLNVNGLLDEVTVDPAAFGFDAPQAVMTCFDDSGGDCMENPAVGLNSSSPDPDKLVFNDAVHPTGRAQALIADYTLSILNAPAQAGMLPVLGRAMAMNALDAIAVQLDGTRMADADNRWGVGIWGSRQEGKESNALYETQADVDSELLSLNLWYRVNDRWRLGAQLSALSGELTTDLADSFYEADGTGFSAFATYGNEAVYLDLVVAYADHDFDTQRAAPIGSEPRFEQGTTGGDSLGLSAELGYDISIADGWRYGPMIAYRYAASEVSGYSERSDTVTALRFGSQELKAKRAEAGIFAAYQAADLAVSFAVALHRHLEEHLHELQMWQLALPEAGGYYLPSYEASKRDGFNARLGAEYHFNDALGLNAGFRMINDEHTTTAADAGVTLRF